MIVIVAVALVVEIPPASSVGKGVLQRRVNAYHGSDMGLKSLLLLDCEGTKDNGPLCVHGLPSSCLPILWALLILTFNALVHHL